MDTEKELAKLNQNKMENYTSVVVAEKLKAIGFKERVLTYYEDGKPKLHNDITGWDFNSSFLNCISRPTFQEVFDWFREKYQLHSTITSISQESWQWHIQKPGQQLGKLYNEDFYTHEEAELACLEKLLEIVESKKE